MTARRRAPSAGFTLLEVVVALALLSLLVSVVYGGFTTAVRAYEAAGERGDTHARMRVVSGFLRRSLGGAFPLAIAGDRDWQLVFEGRRERIRYVGDLPAWLGVGGLHELVIEPRRGDDGEQLVLRRRPIALDRDGEITGEYEDHVLLESVSSLELRYFGSEDARGVPRWREEWPPGRRMPELVELRLADAASGEWPLLVVRPRVDTVRYQSKSAGSGEINVPGAETGLAGDSGAVGLPPSLAPPPERRQ